MPSADPVRLTVGEIRQRIFQASRESSSGSGSLAGQLFHRTVDSSLDPEHPACWRTTFGPDLDPVRWAATLYTLALGPEIGRLQPSLRESGADVLAVWSATQSFARWFASALAEPASRHLIQFDPLTETWRGEVSLFASEVDLSANLKEPGWPRQVIVSGRADHLIRVSPDRWCVVEFKLGGGHPESDAAQVCLYHELLGGSGSAALLRFEGFDSPSQIVFSRESILEARPALMSLIAAMSFAGRAASQNWPKPARESDHELGRRLLRALGEFGADAKFTADPQVGPTFVRYQLEPGRRVSASKIEKQGANVQMRLQLDAEPMIGRASGGIVVDIQRADREFVPFHALAASIASSITRGSRVLAGIDLAGKLHFVDLASDSAHLLVAGVPGGGKSEWLRCAVAGLLLTNTPETLRLVIVDPKKNAFPDLDGSPFLWRPGALIDDPDESVVPVLEALIEEMDRRYDLFKRERADDLARYAAKTGAAPARLLCVVDEYADLVMGAKKSGREEIQDNFIRIAQKGRAAGVHLILATQRPTRQVIDMRLKANIQARVAMRVSSSVESSIVLDQPGAQFLLGKGDLFLASSGAELVRLQSAWMSDDDRANIFGGHRRGTANLST